MTISFDTIPLDIRTFGQYLEFNNTRAVQGTPPQPHVALVIGQGLAAGTVAEATPTQIASADAAEGYWGIGSMIAAMARAFKKANPETELWGISLDDGGGATKGTQTLTFGGAATEDGEIAIYIAGHRVSVAVSDGDAAATIGTNAQAAILAHPDYARFPFVSTAATPILTQTAQHAGTVGNGVDIRHSYQPGESLPAGVTLAIAAGVVGATDPLLATALAAMGDTQYHTIAQPYTDATSLTALEAELSTRWGPMVQTEGHAFCAAAATQANLTTLGNSRNTQWVTILEIGGVAAFSPTTVYEAAAIAAAVDAKQTQIDPAVPRQTLELKGVLAPAEAERFDRSERNTLLTDGIATHYVDGGGVVRVERLITTYQTNPLSAPDTSYLDITTLRTLYFIRYSVRTRIALRYPNHKLADDGTLFDPGQNIVTPSSIKAELVALFREWEASGFVQNGAQYKTDLIVERSTSDPNRVDCRMSPNLIGQFRVFAGQIQFILGAAAQAA